MNKKYIIIHVHREENGWEKLFGWENIKEINSGKGYIVVPIFHKSDKSETIKEHLKDIIEKNKISGEIYACVHCEKSFSLKGIKKVKTYGGSQAYEYCLVNLSAEKLGITNRFFYPQEECQEFPDWDTVLKKLGINSGVVETILSPLLPLHLSLQAFFGISREENGDWKRLPNDLTEEVKEKFGGLFSEENREKAFLLVKEAEWDFYAEIGSRLGESDSASKNEPYENQPLLNLVDKLFENEDEENKGIRKKIEKIIQNEDLRSLCAILANIEDEGINEKLSDEGKLDPEEVKLHMEQIKRSKKVLEEDNYCREWLSKPSHTKWPKDIDNTGNEPRNSYKNLLDQLLEWNKDGDRAKNVIEGIESLADYLQKVESE